MKRILPVLAVVALLVGCATTRQIAPMPDLSKQPTADPAKARIYVLRPTVFGGAIKMNVTDNGQLIGTTGPKGYLVWERDAGAMQLAASAENTSQLPLTVEPGKAYFIQQDVQMGCIMARTQLSVLPEQEGRVVLARCQPPTR